MNIAKLFAVVIIVTTAFTLSYADGWYIEDACLSYAYYTSLALDSSDHPHISYRNNGLIYAYHNGSDWQKETVDTEGGGQTSIALDSSNQPHISYYDYSNGDLKYTYYDGSSWQIEVVDASEYVGLYASIALDSSDRPHISYFDQGNRNLKYAHYNGNDWQKETVDSNYLVGEFTSIALDSSDQPHVSYFDRDNNNLKYTYYDGSSWQIEVVDASENVGWYTSIALDSSDQPHISYFDSLNWDLKYAFYDSYGWHTGCLDPSVAMGYSSSIVMDSLDQPHISYYDGGNFDYNIKYAFYSGSSWQMETVEVVGPWGGYPSIALDSSDNPHISYGSEVHYSLRYAYGVNIGISLTSFSATTQDDAVKLEWNATSDSETIAGFNLYRAAVDETNKKNTVKLNGSLITGSNPYTYLDRNITPSTTYDYTLEGVLGSGKSMMLGNTSGGALLPTDFAITGVHPNPATSTLTCRLAIAAAGELELSLYDLSGRLVQTQRISATPGNTEAVLDVSTLASGVYTLRASSGGVVAVQRVVVAR